MSSQVVPIRQRRLVGLLILATLAGMLYLIFLLRDQASPFTPQFTLYSAVSRADTIRIGTPVTLAGIAVGEVFALDITAGNIIRVGMRLEERYRERIRGNSEARLINPLFGNPHIDIAIGSREAPAVADGGTIPLRRGAGLNELLATLPARLERLDLILANHSRLSAQLVDPAGPLQRGLASFAEGLDTLSDLGERITANEASLRRILANLETLSSRGAEAVGQSVISQRELNRILGSAAETMAAVEASARRFPGDAERLSSILDDIGVLTRDLGSAGPRLSSLVDEGRDLLYETDRTLRAAQRSFLIAPNLPPVDLAQPRPLPLEPLQALPAEALR